MQNHLSWREDGEQLAVAVADKTLRTIYVGDLLTGAVKAK
jgi:hypothetical protein